MEPPAVIMLETLLECALLTTTAREGLKALGLGRVELPTSRLSEHFHGAGGFLLITLRGGVYSIAYSSNTIPVFLYTR